MFPADEGKRTAAGGGKIPGGESQVLFQFGDSPLGRSGGGGGLIMKVEGGGGGGRMGRSDLHA